MSRMESGPLQFGDDWPGVWLRGDEAVTAAFYLTLALQSPYTTPPYQDVITRSILEGLAKTLASCDARTGPLGLRVIPNPNIPGDTVIFSDAQGRELGRIINVKADPQ